MTLPAFDTHAYVKRLKAVGFKEEQAEAQADLQSEVLSTLLTEKLATKEDMSNLERTIKEDIIRLENQTKQELIRLEATFMGRFNLLNWMLGFVLVSVVGLLFKSFFHG